MKWWLSILLLAAFAAGAKAEKEALTYTVLLVRGTDERKPPQQDAKLVSDKIAERLTRFRWKHYWEIRRDSLKVSAATPAKLQLSKDRVLEIIVRGENVDMNLYRQGKVARTIRQKVSADNCEIMGGTDEKDSWFVIVRRKTG